MTAYWSGTVTTMSLAPPPLTCARRARMVRAVSNLWHLWQRRAARCTPTHTPSQARRSPHAPSQHTNAHLRDGEAARLAANEEALQRGKRAVRQLARNVGVLVGGVSEDEVGVVAALEVVPRVGFLCCDLCV